ncbi:natural cytotoxicity triggering receptor 3-like [Spea bombifrons]|uniref:natural cytotoxicity triggering receptor 3-like n=1 Tax=Spea bombifrons TaxID=233779 RepID=UPI00234AC991|nr:natural cytotoxicity triggering receptor 3-like [Spea bombifrons]
MQGSNSHTIHVTQAPKVKAEEGSTVTLKCSYSTSISVLSNRPWLEWHRHVLNGSKVSNTEGDFMGRVSKSTTEDFLRKKSADVTIHNVAQYDTGMFICVVYIHIDNTKISSGHGNGTLLEITGRNKTEESQGNKSKNLRLIIYLFFVA